MFSQEREKNPYEIEMEKIAECLASVGLDPGVYSSTIRTILERNTIGIQEACAALSRRVSAIDDDEDSYLGQVADGTSSYRNHRGDVDMEYHGESFHQGE